MDFKAHIRTVEDFPKPGISFKDITTLLKEKDVFHAAIEEIAERFSDKQIDLVTGPEARGYILASALAYRLGAGFVPIRKLGKLPHKTRRITYSLEYGEDALEVHEDAFKAGQKVLVVDDLLATGGTIRATIDLVESFDARVEGVAVLIELSDLGGRDRLAGHDVLSLVQF